MYNTVHTYMSASVDYVGMYRRKRFQWILYPDGHILKIFVIYYIIYLQHENNKRKLICKKIVTLSPIMKLSSTFIDLLLMGFR